MSLAYPELNQHILDMAEGDEEFREDLTKAIHSGLIELQEKYAEGKQLKDDVIIQQIRHKVKPTLAMFGFDDLSEILIAGKDIIETSGFGDEFDSHFSLFQRKLKVAIQEVKFLLEPKLNS